MSFSSQSSLRVGHDKGVATGLRRSRRCRSMIFPALGREGKRAWAWQRTRSVRRPAASVRQRRARNGRSLRRTRIGTRTLPTSPVRPHSTCAALCSEPIANVSVPIQNPAPIGLCIEAHLYAVSQVPRSSSAPLRHVGDTRWVPIARGLRRSSWSPLCPGSVRGAQLGADLSAASRRAGGEVDGWALARAGVGVEVFGRVGEELSAQVVQAGGQSPEEQAGAEGGERQEGGVLEACLEGGCPLG